MAAGYERLAQRAFGADDEVGQGVYPICQSDVVWITPLTQTLRGAALLIAYASVYLIVPKVFRIMPRDAFAAASLWHMRKRQNRNR